jgi:hypothetical protein
MKNNKNIENINNLNNLILSKINDLILYRSVGFYL